MINLIQPTPVEAPAIADLQCLGLGDPPFHQGVAVLRVVLAPMGFIGGDADIMQSVPFSLEPVDFLPDDVCFEFSGTPAHRHSRPAVAVGRDAPVRPFFKAARLLFWLIKHQPLKAVGMAQSGDVDAPLLEQEGVQLGHVVLHLGELHAGVSV